MKADECLIYTDVDGVYTTDPRIVPEARRLATISFEEMLEMASLGSKVLQIRSVEFAGKYRVPLRVLSSFTPWDIPVDEECRSGTLITFEEDEKMEQAVVSGIAFNRDEAKITVMGVPDKPGIAYQILGPVADANIDIDVIIQNVSHDGKTDFSFTVHRNDYQRTLDLLKNSVLPATGAAQVMGDPQDLQGVDRGHRHAQPRGRGQQDVPHAQRRGHQHPDDHHQRDQDQRGDRREVHGAGRARAAQGLRPGPGSRSRLTKGGSLQARMRVFAWSRDRVAEGAPLLREYVGKTCIEGSNPSDSASDLFCDIPNRPRKTPEAPPVGAFSFLSIPDRPLTSGFMRGHSWGHPGANLDALTEMPPPCP
jgi:hypothetical protein